MASGWAVRPGWRGWRGERRRIASSGTPRTPVVTARKEYRTAAGRAFPPTSSITRRDVDRKRSEQPGGPLPGQDAQRLGDGPGDSARSRPAGVVGDGAMAEPGNG